MDKANRAYYSLIYRGLKYKDSWAIETMAKDNDAREPFLIGVFIAAFCIPLTILCLYYPLHWLGVLMSPKLTNMHSIIAFGILPFILGIFNGHVFGSLAWRNKKNANKEY